MTEPEQIRQDIERTQDNLRADVNALTEKVSPAQIAGRRVEAARSAATGLKERIMGVASDTGSSVRDTVGSAVSGVGDAASSVAGGVGSAASSAGDALSSVPQVARRNTEGNPLAAAVIAFGAGWLVSSLLPPSQRERELAGTVKEKASEQLQPVASHLQQAGQEMAENLRQPAQEAVESVKSTAGDAASTVREEAGSATEHVADRAQHAKQAVTERTPGLGQSGTSQPGSSGQSGYTSESGYSGQSDDPWQTGRPTGS